MRAPEKKKINRLNAANQMKKGYMSDGRGGWTPAVGTIGQMVVSGANHGGRRKA